MSDGMAKREKNERLTAREIEEEEMKRELTGIGIYDPGITYKEMKRLLEFVNESQDTSNVAASNKNMQEGTQHSDNECLSNVTSDLNKQQEVPLQECTEMPRPSYSYRLSRTSPTMHERRSVYYINSPESPSLFESPQNPVHRRKSSDSDELFERPKDSVNSTHGTNRHLSPRSGNVSRGCQNTAEKRMAQDSQVEVVQTLERWRLNPLDVSINEKDVPLRQPNRSSARERIPFEHCIEAHMSDQCDQVIRSVSQHLKEMADLWYSWRPITNSIFQWGSPIQVGATNDSLDKKSLTDPKTEQIIAECTYRDGYERASKRKANTLIANLNRDSSTEDEGSDSQRDFVRVKKKRTQANDKSRNVACATNQHAHINHKKATSDVAYSFSDDIVVDIDNEHVEHLSKRRTDEKDERVSPELTAYPRKITPPNPKTRLSLARQRRRNAISKPSQKTRRTNENKVVKQARDQRKDNTMTEEEIRRQLEDDWNDEEKEDVAVEKNVEIRPLPISKEIRSRLREKQLSKTAKEAQAAAEEEESDEERNKKKKPKLCEQRKKEELCRIENRNGNWEHQLLSDDEDKSSEMKRKFDTVQNDNRSDNVSTSTKNVNCPICNKWFPHNEIEDHAADCEQFETNKEEDNNDTDQLECNICSNYKTNNGAKYEEHVQQCINNRNDRSHSHGSEDTTPTSSFRNFIPISEQKDSEIDYLGQFPSNSKKNVYTGKKRKR